MHDCLIIGGGVIGLSLAHELARQGLSVRVVERDQPGQAASWAGAGILPPATLREEDPPLMQLAGLSHALHPQWAAELRDATRIDTGYHRCGGVYLARDEAEATQLGDQMRDFARRGVRVEPLDAMQLGDLERGLNTSSIAACGAACYLPDEGQLRNPRHLKALLITCRQRGVEISPGCPVHAFRVQNDRIVAASTGQSEIEAGCFCLTAGCWSGGIAAALGVSLPVQPVRGQMVLLRSACPVLRRVINHGPRYLVPRDDGRTLAGSTEEDAGFDCRTTAHGVAGLLDSAQSIAPALADAQIERTWAGLRPGTKDGLPYLGPIPHLKNAFIAAGHFRSGLWLSPGTAVVMSELIRGEKPSIPLHDFRVDRPHIHRLHVGLVR